MVIFIEEKNPLKQGLKQPVFVEKTKNVRNIEEKNPLKQGLKLSFAAESRSYTGDWREESIKTRIETLKASLDSAGLVDWREESIKTRIET